MVKSNLPKFFVSSGMIIYLTLYEQKNKIFDHRMNEKNFGCNLLISASTDFIDNAGKVF